MFISKIINEINALDQKNYKSFKLYAFSYLKKRKYKHNLRLSDFKFQLESFVSGKTSKISFDNLEAYLHSLDKLVQRGSILRDETINWKKGAWGEITFSLGFDEEIASSVDLNYLDKDNTLRLESIIKNIILITSDENKRTTTEKLRAIENFLEVFSKSK